MKNLPKIVVAAGLILGGSLLSSAAYALIPGPTYNYRNGYVSSSNTLYFDQETATSALSPAQCSQANVYKDYYLGADLNNDGIKDLGINYYGRDNFVMNGGTVPVYLIGGRQAGYAGTKVRYFIPAGGQNVLTRLVGTTATPINTQNVFYAQSKIAPKDVWVRAVESHTLLVSAPENNSTASRTFQLAYELAYRSFSARAAGTKTNNYWLYPVSSTDGGPVSTRWNISSSWSSAKPVWNSDYVLGSSPVSAAQIDWGTERRVAYECLNGTVHWCGDGIVDNGSFNIGIASEQCDLGSANGTPGSACTATCKLPLAPLKPDLAIVKSVTGSNVQSGLVYYKLTFNNIGSGMATGVVITDTLGTGLDYVGASIPLSDIIPNPNGTVTVKFNIGNLAAFSGGSITIIARIQRLVPNCSTLRNNVNIAEALGNELTMLNNFSSVSWQVQCVNKPNLYMQKDVVASTGGYTPNGNAIYTLTYGNSGSGTATGVVVTDTLPADLIYSSAVPTPTTVSGQTLTWNIGNLNAGSQGIIKIYVRIRTTVPVCQNYIVNNIGRVTATNASGAQDDAQFVVLCYDLYANKVIDKPLVTSGDIVTYTIRYGNFGPITAPNWSLVDVLPAGLRYISGSVIILSGVNIGQPTVTSTTATGQILTWTGFTNMAAGYSGLVSIKAQVLGPTTAGHVYINSVCIVGDNNYNNNNCGTAVTTVTGGVATGSFFDLNLTKSVDKTSVDNGETVTFTLVVTNESDVPAPVNGYTVQDYLPAGIDYLGSPTGPSGMVTTLSGTKDIIFSNLPNLNPGDRITITFQATFRSTFNETNYAEICTYIGVSATSGIKDRDSNPCNRGRATPVEDDEAQASVGPKVSGCPTCGSSSRPYCGDGIVRVGEMCDPGNPLLGIKPAGVPAGKVCRPDCTYGDQPPGMTAQVKCAYIDPPAINVGEYMPYRWDMEYGYNITGAGLTLATSYCTTATGDIRLNKNTVQCEFTLIGPNGTKKTWQQACYDNPGLPLINTAFNSAKVRYGIEVYPGGFGAIPMTLTGGYYLGLGEYIIEMKAVSGRQCNGKTVTIPDRICQMNFGVTKQYAVTRTPRGTNTSTSDLPTYKRQDKTTVLQISELLKPLEPFTLGSADKNTILAMVNKYVNLSVKADTITDKLDNNTTIVKAIVSKVPGKNIFVIDAKTPMGTKGLITVMDNTTYQGGAFTLIVINGDLVVKGNLQKNPNGMFIVRDGDLTFSAIGDALENNQDQLVKGIFIGLNNIKAEGDNQPAFNNDLNKPWINGGRLTVQGIILGDDLTKMVEGRRSIVEDWFYKRAGDGLLDDGSLVIKANPEIFTNLPPGAEDISTTLNVFKK